MLLFAFRMTLREGIVGVPLEDKFFVAAVELQSLWMVLVVFPVQPAHCMGAHLPGGGPAVVGRWAWSCS